MKQKSYASKKMHNNESFGVKYYLLTPDTLKILHGQVLKYRRETGPLTKWLGSFDGVFPGFLPLLPFLHEYVSFTYKKHPMFFQNMAEKG
jgi:hypothetical protein